jgi:activator of 2-hydroxyglutaryl-CoA dehydratase
MHLADFGTTWTKLMDTQSGEKVIKPTRQLGKYKADIATGHNARRRSRRQVNELSALTYGGIRRLGPGPWTLIDIGSRDMKLVQVKNGLPVRMDWNNTCGAMTGFTLELLGRYFELDFNSIQPAKKVLPITCGVLGMERLFDKIASGMEIIEAMARFTRGMAQFAHAFMHRPEHFYLSGGMCENELFMKSFPSDTQVEALGRFLLLEGLTEKERRE